MGMFDSYVSQHYPEAYGKPKRRKMYKHFKHQSSFDFYKGFGLLELKRLVDDAVAKKQDTVWLPQEDKSRGQIGVSTWYAAVLVERESVAPNASNDVSEGSAE